MVSPRAAQIGPSGHGFDSLLGLELLSCSDVEVAPR